MKTIRIFIIVFILLAILFNIYPPIAGIGKGISILGTPQSQQKEKVDNTVHAAREAVNEYREIVMKPAVKTIYRTRTRTVKPREITLYVRQPDGTITEHKVQSDGGFYIVELNSLAKESEYIEFKEDSSKLSPVKKNFLQKLFKRNP